MCWTSCWKVCLLDKNDMFELSREGLQMFLAYVSGIIDFVLYIVASDVFKLLSSKYKKLDLVVSASFFEIYSGKVSWFSCVSPCAEPYLFSTTDHFTDPSRADGLPCRSLCLPNNFWTKWLLTSILGMLVYIDSARWYLATKVIGQSSWDENIFGSVCAYFEVTVLWIRYKAKGTSSIGV